MGAHGGGLLASFLPIVFVLGIFYFLVIRPQRQEEEAKRKMREALRHGDRVVTTCGIHGVVVGTSERTVTLRIAERTNVEFERSAVAAKAPEERTT